MDNVFENLHELKIFYNSAILTTRVQLELQLAVENFGGTIVNRYVRALHEVSSGREAEFVQQIKAVREAVESLDDRERVLRRFSLLVKEGEIFVDTLVSELELFPEVGNFLKLILSNKRFSIILDICTAFEKFCDHMDDKKTFYITYAKDFSEEIKAKLASRLEEVVNGKVAFVVKRDESLIDGLQIRYGSKILDYSAKSKLERLKRSMRGETRA